MLNADHGNGVVFEVDGCMKRREVVRLKERLQAAPLYTGWVPPARWVGAETA